SSTASAWRSVAATAARPSVGAASGDRRARTEPHAARRIAATAGTDAGRQLGIEVGYATKCAIQQPFPQTRA
ncbi:hypothetical protein ABFW14_29290, partial [Mycolicibacterium fortuitum]|uniref:hypothetical protein n=1 Tax=Mycolicibacterium fortuitum TaxID=1766 RepID=UPI0034CF57D3